MMVVGVGAGPRMLTLEAIEALRGAGLIYGSKRAIELAREFIPDGCTVRLIEDYRRLHELPSEAVVLSTGDPMLSGLGRLGGRVVPGVSSLQVACARLKVSELDVVPVSAHGRDLDPELVAFELRRGKCVFLLMDDRTDLERLCKHLESEGITRRLAVLTDLGYPDERIREGTTSSPPDATGLSCVLIGDI
ncbi:MAG: cobalt-precorrin-7 (C(5))-methyltransferase [Methanothrix sp.]|nr:cobalt-precorrin-7 (C(5))-methyltransferase [Methanothrix sp.]